MIPGGVDSPVRAFGAVGGTPIFVDWGEGAYLVDVDGDRYVDLVQSWGALLFGHAHPAIVEAAAAAAAKVTSFGAPTAGEVELDQAIGPGASGTVTLTAPRKPGKYTFYCPVGDHKEEGMTGRLVVRQAKK